MRISSRPATQAANHAHPPAHSPRAKRRKLGHPQPPVPPLPATLPAIKPPSDAGGEWPIDHAAARKFAQITLDQIDWSKPDLILWVSGTANPKKGEFPQIAPDFANAVYRVWQNGGASLNLMRYESSWAIRQSMATGVETLRLVLRGIADRKGGHRVLLAGESQGAWVIGEALKDPEAHKAVTRTALWGHPSIAAEHYDDGHDPKVSEINHKLDRVAMPIGGNKSLAMDAMIAIESNLNASTLPVILRAFAQNPGAGMLTIFSVIRGKMPPPIQGLMPEPHHYGQEFLKSVEWLRNGGTRPVAEHG